MKKIAFMIVLVQIMQSGHAADPQTSATFKVEATIENGCSLSTVEQNINFGQHSALAQNKVNASIVNSTQTWNVRCTERLPVSIMLNGGDSFSNNQRRLKHASSNQYVPYQLFSTSNLSSQYVSGNSYALSPATTSNKVMNFAVYAVADLNNNNQSRAAGLYKDTVAITISW